MPSWAAHDDPVVEIDRLIGIQREEHHLATVALIAAQEHYAAALVHADQAAGSVAIQRKRRRDAADEIDTLLEERHQLIPQPRNPP